MQPINTWYLVTTITRRKGVIHNKDGMCQADDVDLSPTQKRRKFLVRQRFTRYVVVMCLRSRPWGIAKTVAAERIRLGPTPTGASRRGQHMLSFFCHFSCFQPKEIKCSFCWLEFTYYSLNCVLRPTYFVGSCSSYGRQIAHLHPVSYLG